ncbi:MAG TPA: ABC transporter substrate-binding protein [Longimicrobiales bacterium]|nr:ABC transporter substrate-binding protein [Longimicrobiales bacterium]
MKRILALGAAAVATACGGTEGAIAGGDPFCREVLPRVAAFMEQASAAHPVPDDPRYGGTVVVGNYGELVGGMNAATSTDAIATQHQQFVNLMTLIDYDERFEPRPYLAESWEVAPDGTSVTFHLRRDVYWHDGEPTDAHDVAFTWEVVNDPLTGYPNPAFWSHYVPGPEGVEVLDDYTVRFRLEPHLDFLDPFRTLAILPEHLLGDVPRDRLREHPYGTQCPVGNGPFVFESHSPQEQWVFRANPAFPEGLGGRPFVDRYVYRIVTEQTTLLTELLTGSIDLYIEPSPDQAQAIFDHPDLELLRHIPRQYNYIGWNARRPTLADARVRRAITMATDRERIVEAILRGYGRIAHTGVPPYHWAYAPDALPVIEYDPDAARALLDEAGWRDHDGDGVRESADGTRLSLSIKYNPNVLRRQVAEILQAQLAEVGIEIVPQVVEWTTLVRQITDPVRRDFDGVIMAWVPEFRLDDTDLFHSSRIDDPYALAGTSNPEIDRLLEEIAAATDREEAKALWLEYQALLIQEQPYMYFYFPERLAGVNRRLRNVQMDARGEWVNIKDWYIDPASR